MQSCPHRQEQPREREQPSLGDHVGNSYKIYDNTSINHQGGNIMNSNRGRQWSSNGGSIFPDSCDDRLSTHNRHWRRNGDSRVQDSYDGRLSSHHCHQQNGDKMRYSRSHNHNHIGRGSND